MRGVFQSAGQNCIGIERIIALPHIHDKLLNHVLPKIKGLRLGNVLSDSSPPDMGAMISSRTFSYLESMIAYAVVQGAILHHGGHQYNHPNHSGGTYFEPTLLSNVTKDMKIANTELFAPVFLLMRADNVDEAIDIANSTPYALGASDLWSQPKLKCRDVSKMIKAGSVASQRLRVILCMQHAIWWTRWKRVWAIWRRRRAEGDVQCQECDRRFVVGQHAGYEDENTGCRCGTQSMERLGGMLVAEWLRQGMRLGWQQE